MRRIVVLAVLLLAGCQGDNTRYDAAAKAKARAVAPSVASYGKLLAVGPARERPECSEAQPFVAGRCLDVVVTRRFPVIDKPGKTVRDDSHVFVWLERQAGGWTVSHTAVWSPNIRVEISGGEPSPPWLAGGYAQQPATG